MSFRTKAKGAALTAGVLAGLSGYVFSQRSVNNIVETHPHLQELTQCALEKSKVDFVVIDGKRTLQEHLINVKNGRSWTKRSRHVDGLAIDFAAYVNGKITYDPQYYTFVAAAFYHCSDKKGYPIVWGGEWKAQDLMHIELDRGAYPAGEV